MSLSARKPIKDWNAKTPEQEAIHQRMLDKCAKNANPVAPEPVPEPEQVIAAILEPQLIWGRSSSHCMLTSCQRYQVTKELIGDYVRNSGFVINAGVIRYQPWVRTGQVWYIHLGPYVETFEQAKETCEAHLRKPAIT